MATHNEVAMATIAKNKAAALEPDLAYDDSHPSLAPLSEQKPSTHAHDVLCISANDIATRLHTAQQQCQRKGVRFTTLRRTVYQLILQSDKPMGAYDLVQSLQAARLQEQGAKAKMVAPPTIYRTLDFLLQLGLIHQLTSLNAFVPCCHPRDQHNAVFLLCRLCHRVQECSDLPGYEVSKYVNNDLGFRIEKSVMELTGRCQSCVASTIDKS